MINFMENLNISNHDVKQIDIVNYLEKLGYKPAKVTKNDYWYLSPLRDEKTPSFKVNKSINCWYDFGLGEAGSLIDFGIKYFNCSVKQFLDNLNAPKYNKVYQPALSFHRYNIAFKSQNDEQNKIKIT